MTNIHIENTYFGFTNNKKPMQAARIEKSLDMLIRFDEDDKIKTKKEFVYIKLKEGLKPSIEEDFTYYSSRLDDYTKPRTLYKLEYEDGSYHEINKTLYDYALYLIENNFLDEEVANAFIQNEIAEKEEKERLEQEKIKKEREEAEKKRQQEELKSKERARLINEKYSKLGNEFINRLGYDPIKKVLENHLPKFYEIVEEQNKETLEQDERDQFYNEIYSRMLYTLGHNDLCIDMMKRYAEDYKEGYYKPYELENIYLFLDQQLIFEVYNTVKLTDKPITITAKMKAAYEGREYKGQEI